MKTVRKKQAIEKDLSRFVDTETGETLLQEGITVKLSKDTDTVTIYSDEYFTIDIKVLHYLLDTGIITSTELGHINIMATTLKTEYNALYRNNNIPHCTESLALELKLSVDKTKKMLTKLRKANIIYFLIRSKDKIYLMNPYLARRRKTFSEDLIEIFPKFINEKV